MRRFGTEKVKNMLLSLGMAETEAIRSKTFTKSIETAQKKVEGNNYDTRKNLLDYDNVMNQQREIISKRRTDLIDMEDIQEEINTTFEAHIAALIYDHIPPEGYLTEADIEDI